MDLKLLTFLRLSITAWNAAVPSNAQPIMASSANTATPMNMNMNQYHAMVTSGVFSAIPTMMHSQHNRSKPAQNQPRLPCEGKGALAVVTVVLVTGVKGLRARGSNVTVKNCTPSSRASDNS